MTEVPEHLLRRAKERRAALSGEGGDDGPPADAAAPPSSPSAPSTAIEPAAPAGAPAQTARAVAVPVVDDTPSPTYIAIQKQQRTRVPIWAMPILVVLPFWGILYTGAFGSHDKAKVEDPLIIGQQVYSSAGCSSCHGAQGQGGVGPALAKGEAALTFPKEEDHISWVKTGSGPFTGKPYGDPDREGGQRGPAKGIMPAFGGSLSDAQIQAVVKYEREKL